MQGSKYLEQKQRRAEIQKRKNQIHDERKRAAYSLRIQRRQNDQRKQEFINDLRMKSMLLDHQH